MKALVLLALLSLPAPAHACKPAPIKHCEEKGLIPLHAPSFEALSEKVAAFHNELTASLSHEPPRKSRASCFNSSFAPHFISQAREASATREGKICSEHIQRIKQSAEALVNADSPEWKAIKGKTEQASLSVMAKKVRSALEEFLHQH